MDVSPWDGITSPKHLAMCLCEASPHKRRLKCDTNIGPRRLIIHLLHQMVHHHITLRGNGQWSATIARITTKTQTRTLTTKRSSESCAIRSFLRVTLSTGKVGCRTESLLNILGNKLWIFLCKNWARVSTNVLSKSNHTHGGGINRVQEQDKSRRRLGFKFCRKLIFMHGFILKPCFP
jgi:hypothetical protein